MISKMPDKHAVSIKSVKQKKTGTKQGKPAARSKKPAQEQIKAE